MPIRARFSASSRLWAAAFLVLSTLGLAAQFPGKEWERVDDLAAAGWSAEKLAEARAYAGTLQTEAVMVVHQGRVVDSWGPVDRKFNVHSIRKSFLSAMYGVQVAAGKIQMEATMAQLGVDDNEPALSEEEKKATVADLLKARSGIYHPALYETKKMKAARPKRHSHAPGTFWYYNNWDFNVLGTIYEQKTGHGIYQDFKDLIATPTGMQDYEVADGQYFTGPDSIHRAYPFRMTARDMARFGLLFLQGGKWGDKQIIPASWVKESTTSYSDAKGSGGYGYLWWIAVNGRHMGDLKTPEGAYSARGSGGHYILVIPSMDMVIVHRVNTDIESRSVDTPAFGKLVEKILAARTKS